ncbi:MAG: type II toxin-antitoxin system VapC family toxin [Cyanobacteria bacterium P01_E01_bin.42]
MSLIFLLDTNTLSEPLRPRPNENVLRKIATHRQEIAMATPVIQEILFGCNRLPLSRKRRQIETYLQKSVLSKIPILSYDLTAAVWHARERARLVSIGRTPPFADSQIAAIAKANDLILVTNNIADYANFNDLEVENWHG